MSEFSLEPPERQALTDAELSERVANMSADEVGLEAAMKLVEEQERLRELDSSNLQQWVDQLKSIGSKEALEAVSAVTGEVFVFEPEIEPLPTETEPVAESDFEVEIDAAVATETDSVSDSVSELANEAEGSDHDHDHDHDSETQGQPATALGTARDWENEVALALAAEAAEFSENPVVEASEEVVSEEGRQSDVVDPTTDFESSVPEVFADAQEAEDSAENSDSAAEDTLAAAAESLDEVEEVDVEDSFDEELEGEVFTEAISVPVSSTPVVKDFSGELSEALATERSRRLSRVNVRILAQSTIPLAAGIVLSGVISRFAVSGSSLLVGLLAGSILAFVLILFSKVTKLSGYGFTLSATAAFGRNLGLAMSWLVLGGLLSLMLGASSLLGSNLKFEEISITAARIYEYELASVELLLLFVLVAGLAFAFVEQLRKPMAIGAGVLGVGGTVVLAVVAGLDGFDPIAGEIDWFAASLVAATVLTAAVFMAVLIGSASNISGNSSRFATAVSYAVLPAGVAYALLMGSINIGSASDEFDLILLFTIFGLGASLAMGAILSQVRQMLFFVGRASAVSAFVLVAAALFAGEYLHQSLSFDIALVGLIVLASVFGVVLADQSLRNQPFHAPSLSQSYGFYGGFDAISVLAVVVGIAAGWVAGNPFGLLTTELFLGYEEIVSSGAALAIAAVVPYATSMLRLNRIKTQEFASTDLDSRRELTELVLP